MIKDKDKDKDKDKEVGRSPPADFVLCPSLSFTATLLRNSTANEINGRIGCAFFTAHVKLFARRLRVSQIFLLRIEKYLARFPLFIDKARCCSRCQQIKKIELPAPILPFLHACEHPVLA
jgi:hypothetical protein